MALAVSARPSHAERVTLHAYPTEPLPSPALRSVYQDAQGYLWVGTESGLARYDGTTFTPFGAAEGVNVGAVARITQDATGRIWAGATSGLAVQDGDRFVSLSEADGLPGVRVLDLAPTEDGVLIAASHPGGVARVRWPAGAARPVVVGITVRPDGAAVDAQRVALTASGALLVGTSADGLYVLGADGSRQHHLPGVGVWALQPDGGAVLVASGAGLWRFEGGALHAPFPGTRLATEDLRAVHRSRDRALYAGTARGQLLRARGEGAAAKVEALVEHETGSHISHLAEEAGGTVWASLWGPGLLRVRPGDDGALLVDSHHGLPDADVRGLYADRNGLVFVSTLNGLVRVVSSAVTTVDANDGLPASTVWSVARLPGLRPAGQGGGLVFGTQGGLALLRGGRVVVAGTAEGLPSSMVVRTWPEADGSVLAATLAGLARVRFDGPRPAAQPLAGKFPAFSVVRTGAGRAFVAGPRGLGEVRGDAVVPFPMPGLGEGDAADHVILGHGDRVWIASVRGLFALDPDGRVSRLGKAQGLLDDDVLAVAELDDGTVWVAYTKNLGATAVRGARGWTEGNPTPEVMHLREAQGLPSDSVYAFAGAGRDGDVWIGTSRGLVRRRADGSLQRFGRNAGFPTEDISQNSIFVDDDGSVWVGTALGASQLRPDLLPPPRPPEPVLTRVTLGTDAAFGNAVPYERRDFEARFSSLLFEGEDKTLFRYRMVGYRDEWTPFRGDRLAMFSNLPPGRYRFEVEARSEDGLTSRASAHLAFQVLPPFYRTAWFVSLATVAGLLGVAGIVSVSRGRLAARNRALEAKVQERTLELSQRLEELRTKNAALDRKNDELARINGELVASQARAERIFSALADALPGTVIDGKYRLEGRIGAGGAGVVFRATHLDLNRPIAVKIFKPAQGNDSADALERFRLEGKSASRLEHPHAVQVYDSGISSEGLAYLVMQLLEGHPLSEELAGGRRVPAGRASAVIAALADVLAHAHGLGIIHRDVKPENVFVQETPDGDVYKLLDFGIAKLTGESGLDSHITMEGVMLGTPAYMAPERLDGSLVCGPESDVYSLGALAYRLLSGRLPFEGSITAIITGHLVQMPPHLAALVPATPTALANLVMRALAKDPATRPTARELAEAFAAAASEAPAARESVGMAAAGPE